MKLLGKMNPGQWEDYFQNDPNKMGDKVRKWFKVPENRYYSVSIWPENLSGNVWLNEKLFRDVPKKKISKSDQK